MRLKKINDSSLKCFVIVQSILLVDRVVIKKTLPDGFEFEGVQNHLLPQSFREKLILSGNVGLILSEVANFDRLKIVAKYISQNHLLKCYFLLYNNFVIDQRRLVTISKLTDLGVVFKQYLLSQKQFTQIFFFGELANYLNVLLILIYLFLFTQATVWDKIK